jgi:hypothetical protein
MNVNELDFKLDSQFLSPDNARWAAYLSANQLANVFHHPAWSYLLAETYSYEPLVLAACNAQGDIQGAIPLIRIRSPFNKQRLVSLPFTDHCSPLFSDQSTIQQLSNHLAALSKEDNVSRIDLRSEYPTLPAMYRYSDYVLHRLRLAPDESEVSNRIKPKHFRQVKVAEQRGVRIERGVDRGFVRQFYHLHILTRRRKGVPVQPWRFFDLLVQHITQAGLGFILLAYKDRECVAGAVFLNWNSTLTYKYSASTEKARPLLAMDLLLWTAIQWGCENGYEWMDMGRTDNEDEGLKYFKGRWGAEEAPLHYCTIPEAVQKPTSGHWAGRVRPLIQRSPPWVCRAAGELLYRYFG